ncbi:histidine kinase-like protein [Actinocorallia herbida]|uniref:Histidine kinase-like protein n=1 Tax=Actinocorallia herbida TaxID=58109 RepID=A0A3N1CUX4_9ACTN|nr:ATP-binding protein [Actinocorallia herbida]ROO85035.1 histidine kinase-like protein [Actinocorallia herbida]
MTVTTDDLSLTMLAARPSAGLARTLIAQRLTRWGCPHLADDALLIATELLTNAFEATPGARIRLRVAHDRTGVLIAVWDSSPHLPTPRRPTPLTLESLDASPNTYDHGGGWGLPLIAALSTAHGHHPDRTTGGKWTWATLTHHRP